MNENLFALFVCLLSIIFLYFFIKKLEKNRINKIGLENHLQQKEENIIYERNRKVPVVNKMTNFLLEASYRSKIDYFFIALFLVFIISGLFFIYLNRHKENLLDRYIVLVFPIFGILLLYNYLFTVYHIKEKKLIIKHGGETNIINYQNITKIEKHIINLWFRHGIKGRERAETHKDTLWIFYNDDKNTPRIIMISPLEKDRFVEHIISKIINHS